MTRLTRHTANGLCGLAALAGLLAACGRGPAPAAPGEPAVSAADGAAAAATSALPRAGAWRATVQLPGGELPFGIEFGSDNGAPVAWLVNGAERVRVDEIATPPGGLLTLRMPGFQNRIEARVDGDTLRGELVLPRAKGEPRRLPFAAAFGANWRFFEQPAAQAANVAGRWAATFGEGTDATIAVGEFAQQGTVVTGTFLTPTGDHRFLAGEVRGNELYLSRFDGGSAALYRATLGPAGELVGAYDGPAGATRWTARRDAGASLGDAESRTRMRSADAALDITFPDVDGRTVSLRDARFAGKVIVVAIAGSWCPNCHDEAAFLAPLYNRLRDDGLEVVSLMFEQFGDFARAAEAVGRFRDEHDIAYTTLIAGVSDKDDAASKLPQLNGVFAFPTTIFIDRSGRVRKVHTGFSGPATGEHHRQLTREIESLVTGLLAESSGQGA
jgi:peroxiredoxin